MAETGGAPARLADQQIRQIRAQVRKAPSPPAGVAIPHWLDGLEDMQDFFDQMATVWDQFSEQKLGLEASGAFYGAVADAVAATDLPVTVLDIGCGTGLEFGPIWARAPRAAITGMDLSGPMLAQARAKFGSRDGHLTLVQQSYVAASLTRNAYDYVVAVLTVHHLPPDTKRRVYAEVRAALRPGGAYIEGDHSASPETEKEALRWYTAYVSHLPGGARGAWNYNLPLSVATQQGLLREAGFHEVALTWEERGRDGNGTAVLVARG
jgi:tRNA (cmo5U34)-methyltransferase